MTSSEQMALVLDRDLMQVVLRLAEKLEVKVPEAARWRLPDQKVLAMVRKLYDGVLQRQQLIPLQHREVCFGALVDEIFGFGPLEILLEDDSVTEVMVNGPHLIYVEQNGRLVKSPVKLVDDAHVVRIIQKIVKPLGRHIDEQSPLVDARLPDGSRVNAVVAPCAIDGPSITIRKYAKNPPDVQDLINFGSMTPDMAAFLRACVVSKLNIVVAGGSSSGKTTLLNVLSSFIPDEERIVTIEDAAELRLRQRHVIRAETKKKSRPEDVPVTTRDLVKNALRMRPDRIIVGECRGSETLDMLQAMNTGHDGSLTTTHANTPRDTISRLETLVLMSGMDLPLSVIRLQIVSAVHMIVQQARLRDGSRKVINISEIVGMEGDNVILQDIFRYDEQGKGEDGAILGAFTAGGYRPRNEAVLRNHGFDFPPEMFLTTAARERHLLQQQEEAAAKEAAASKRQQGRFGRRRR